MIKFDASKLKELKQVADEIGDMTMLTDLVKLFIETVPAQMNDVIASQKEQDTVKIKEIFHSMKSTSGTLGLMALQEECLKQEMKAKAGDLITESEIKEIEVRISDCIKFLLELESKEFNF